MAKKKTNTKAEVVEFSTPITTSGKTEETKVVVKDTTKEKTQTTTLEELVANIVKDEKIDLKPQATKPKRGNIKTFGYTWNGANYDY